MFRQGIPATSIQKIRCPGERERGRLLQAFRNAGITEVNGVLFTLRAAPVNLLHKRLNAFVPYTHAHRFLSASRSVYRRKAHSA